MEMMGPNRKKIQVPELKCSKCGKPWAVLVDCGTQILPRIDPYCLCEEPGVNKELKK